MYGKFPPGKIPTQEVCLRLKFAANICFQACTQIFDIHKALIHVTGYTQVYQIVLAVCLCKTQYMYEYIYKPKLPLSELKLFPDYKKPRVFSKATVHVKLSNVYYLKYLKFIALFCCKL